MSGREAPHESVTARGPLGWWRAQNADFTDRVAALALALASFVPTLSQVGAQLGDLARRPVDALCIALVLGQSLPLALRHRQPAICLAVVGAAFGVHQASGYPTTFASLGLYSALYSVGAHQATKRRAVAVVATAGYAGLALAVHDRGSPQHLPVYLAFYSSLVLFWLAGTVMRTRRAEEVQRRELAAELATADERARIARELHDVVTHHVTAMVVQADAAQFLVESDPERTATSLAAVSSTGRRALTELRHLLGVLEATGDGPGGNAVPAQRAPVLGEVADLIEQARAAGQAVELVEHGQWRQQADSVELACYRVVQEGLTNAMKHAAGQRTSVSIQYGEQRIAIDVITEGPAGSTPASKASPASGRRGLTGLAGRIRLLDGRFEAGPGPDGGFQVRAEIPTRPLQESR
jgi:signal transduction histidine kinase